MLCDITIKEKTVPIQTSIAAAETAVRRETLLDGLVGYRLRRASTHIVADFSMTMAPLQVRPVLFAVLAIVRAMPGIIQRGLGTELGIQRANLVPLVNELTRRGLMARRADPTDRRALALYLTKAGEHLLDEAAVLVRDHEDRMLIGLSPSDRATLLALLEKILPCPSVRPVSAPPAGLPEPLSVLPGETFGTETVKEPSA
jgi:DNA-binding MarR family transcriptional regulator